MTTLHLPHRPLGRLPVDRALSAVRQWCERHVVADEPAPELTGLDRLDRLAGR